MTSLPAYSCDRRRIASLHVRLRPNACSAVAVIAEAVVAVHERGVRRGLHQRIAQPANTGVRRPAPPRSSARSRLCDETDIARRDGQCRPPSAVVLRDHDRQRVIDARIGVDQQSCPFRSIQFRPIHSTHANIPMRRHTQARAARPSARSGDRPGRLVAQQRLARGCTAGSRCASRAKSAMRGTSGRSVACRALRRVRAVRGLSRRCGSRRWSRAERRGAAAPFPTAAAGRAVRSST